MRADLRARRRRARRLQGPRRRQVPQGRLSDRHDHDAVSRRVARRGRDRRHRQGRRSRQHRVGPRHADLDVDRRRLARRSRSSISRSIPTRRRRTSTSTSSSILRDLPAGTRPEVRKADPRRRADHRAVGEGPAGHGEPRPHALRRQAGQEPDRAALPASARSSSSAAGCARSTFTWIRSGCRRRACRRSISRAVSASNVSVPGGSIESGPTNATLRIESRVVDPQDLCKIVVRDVGGHQIHLADVVEAARERAARRVRRRLRRRRADRRELQRHSGDRAADPQADRHQHRRRRRRDPGAGRRARARSCRPATSVEMVRDNSIQIRTSADDGARAPRAGLAPCGAGRADLPRLRCARRSSRRSRSRCRSSPRSA